uniref:Uncharacterized protein n=1 Tax=Bursaphelenchus xylophilus TaxID=6326 RepID=A0A1I7SD62_BURXY
MIPALNVAIGLIRRAYCVRSQTAQSFCSVTRTASLFRGLAALGGNPATPGYELSQSNASIYQKKVEESAESQVERRLIDGEKGSQIEEEGPSDRLAAATEFDRTSENCHSGRERGVSFLFPALSESVAFKSCNNWRLSFPFFLYQSNFTSNQSVRRRIPKENSIVSSVNSGVRLFGRAQPVPLLVFL